MSPESGTINGQFEIMKRNDEQRIAFGWAYQCVTESGQQMIDHSGETIEISELEKAAYNFVKLYRDGSDNHERGGVGTVIESMVFTKEKATALNIPDGTIPQGWWVGFKITDDDVWKKVKTGEYSMFSIEGRATRVDI